MLTICIIWFCNILAYLALFIEYNKVFCTHRLYRFSYIVYLLSLDFWLMKLRVLLRQKLNKIKVTFIIYTTTFQILYSKFIPNFKSFSLIKKSNNLFKVLIELIYSYSTKIYIMNISFNLIRKKFYSLIGFFLRKK